MRRLLRLFDDPETFFLFLTQIFAHLPAILILLLGIYFIKNYKKPESKLVFIGAIINTIVAAGYIFMSTFYMKMLDGNYESIQYIYLGLNLVRTLGLCVFLYGIYKIIKNIVEEGKNDNSLFIK